MRFRSIRICNVSSYAGECFLDFTLTNEKNLILIGGQNGTGKTSLFASLKLALYGHLSFNYQSVNGQYLARVREMINNDAFISSSVNAFIEVEIEIPDERDSHLYRMRRAWNYIDNRLSETFDVWKDEELLSDEKLLFFQNYLFTELPPNLFGFYFFDGEQVADFFTLGSSNTYLKNALLTLCNYDTFEIIRKYCESYVSSTDLIGDNQIAKSFEKNSETINRLHREQVELEQKIRLFDADIENAMNMKAALEEQFRNSGGLTEDEKDELLKHYRDLENEKSEYVAAIKAFLETDMPFIISRKLSFKIAEQLEREEEIKKYRALHDKLNSPQIARAIADAMSIYSIAADNDMILAVTRLISVAVKPDVDVDAFELLHDLSQEQREQVQSVLGLIAKFQPSAMLQKVADREKATQATIAINKKLREAMSENDAAAFSARLTDLTNRQFDLQRQQEATAREMESNKQALIALEAEQKVLFEKLRENIKSENVYVLTRKISSGLDAMIKRLTARKFRLIEAETLSMLKRILRKENFIDLIEMDKDFNVEIYKEQTYQTDELENLVRNISPDELEKRIGRMGTAHLLEMFSINSVAKLSKLIRKQGEQTTMFSPGPISLYKRIDLCQLSKGEKQIFILALYYAIIKVADKDIPFIIDTPYARIDTEHREQISREFFPKISGQVIILSTDEEVTHHYYGVLKPLIAKEYLLEYDDAASKTVVSDGYFFKE